jgi:uncharacterized membrane protein YfcA
MDLPPGSVILAAGGVLLAAGFVQGITGFGLSLLAVPLLGMLLGIRDTVPILVMLSMVTNAWIAWGGIRELRWKLIAAMLVAAVPGVPLGIWLLTAASPSMLKTVAGVIIAAFALCAAVDFSFMRHARIRAPYLFGFASGVMNGSISLSGPPIVAYFAIERVPKDAFRSTISAYFLLLNVATLAGMFLRGVCGARETVLAAALLPGLALGTLAGVLVAARIDDVLFRRITLGLLLVSGLYTALAG